MPEIALTRLAFPWALLIFWKRRVALIWGGIALVVFIFQIAISGIIHDNESIQVLLKFLDMLPPVVIAMLGGEALQAGNIAALIGIGYQHPMVLLCYMLYAVGIPTALLAGETERGTMELILCRCATKTQVYLCVAILTISGMFALLLVTFMGTLCATAIYTFDQKVPLFQFFQIAVNGGLLASAVGAIALWSAASFRSRKTAIFVSVTFLVVNYFISIIAEYWPRMAFLEKANIFYYANGYSIFALNQWPIKEMCILTILLLISAMAGAVTWHLRDLQQ